MLGLLRKLKREREAASKSLENALVAANCITVYDMAMIIRQMPGKKIVTQIRDVLARFSPNYMTSGPLSKLSPEEARKLPDSRSLTKPWDKKDSVERQETMLVLAALGAGFDPSEKLGIYHTDDDKNAQEKSEAFLSKLIGRHIRVFSNRKEKITASRFLFTLGTYFYGYVKEVNEMTLHDLDRKVEEILSTKNQRERWSFLFALLSNPRITREKYIKALRFGSINEVFEAFPALDEDKIPYLPRTLVLEDEKKIKTPWIEYYLSFLAAREGKELDLNFAVTLLNELFLQEMAFYDSQIKALTEDRNFYSREVAELKQAVQSITREQLLPMSKRLSQVPQLEAQAAAWKTALEKEKNSNTAKALYHKQLVISSKEQRILELERDLKLVNHNLTELYHENRNLKAQLDSANFSSGLMRIRRDLDEKFRNKRFLVLFRGTAPEKYVSPLESLGAIVDMESVEDGNVRRFDSLANSKTKYDFIFLPVERSTHTMSNVIRKGSIPFIEYHPGSNIYEVLLKIKT